MNKILLLSFILSCISCTCIYSQVSHTFPKRQVKQEKIEINQTKRDSINLVFQERIESNIIAKAGYYLSLSAKHQYGALGCAAISAACFFGASKCNSTITNDGSVQRSTSYYALNLFGGATAIACIYCEIMAINYKLKSGKIIMLSPTPNGVTASIKF